MVVRMRLRPTGLRNNPSYDVVVVQGQRRIRAAPIEKLGEYQVVPSVLQTPRASTSSILQPIPEPKFEKSLKLNKERIGYWIQTGAQPSQSVSRLLTKAGIMTRDFNGKHTVYEGLGSKSASKAVTPPPGDAPANAPPLDEQPEKAHS